MPSINLDVNYFDHIKAIRLEARLGPGADVLPIRLWAYVGKCQPGSAHLKLTAEEIERMCRWWGEKGAMIAAMIQIKLINAVGDLFEVNDWFEHSGHLAAFKKRAEKAAKSRWMLKRSPSIAKEHPKQCSCSTCSTSSTSITSKDTPATDGRVQPLVDRFYQGAGKPVSFPGGQAAKFFKSALAKVPQELIEAYMDNWFASTDPYIIREAFRFGLFVTKFDALKGGPIHANTHKPANAFVASAGESSKYDRVKR